jgi:hypothetical protein
VYRVISGVRTKLRRKLNSSGGALQGFYIDRGIFPCPQIVLNISLARKTLFVEVSGAGSSPDGASAGGDATLSYDFDWSGSHKNPEPNGISLASNIGYRPLILSCGPDTSGNYTMTSGAWGVGGKMATGGDYFEIGEVEAYDTDLIFGDGASGCGGSISCAPLNVCNGLLTEYPIQISAHSEGVDCSNFSKVWCEVGDPGVPTYTDCDTVLSEPFELCTEWKCRNFNSDFTADWTPCLVGPCPGNPFGLDVCSWFTGHTAAVDANNPAQGFTHVCCGSGSDSTLVGGHEGAIQLTGITAGFGFEGGTNGARHLLDQEPSGHDFPAFWLPSDVIGKWMHNHGGPGPTLTPDCIWAIYVSGIPVPTLGQQMKLLNFFYESSD